MKETEQPVKGLSGADRRQDIEVRILQSGVLTTDGGGPGLVRPLPWVLSHSFDF